MHFEHQKRLWWLTYVVIFYLFFHKKTFLTKFMRFNNVFNNNNVIITIFLLKYIPFVFEYTYVRLKEQKTLPIASDCISKFIQNKTAKQTEDVSIEEFSSHDLAI